MAATVRQALNLPMDNMQISVSVLESKAGELRAEVFHDAQAFERTLSLPVTLPPVDLSLAKRRVTGCVYAAGACDATVVKMLRRIFPQLKVWSPAGLDVGRDQVTGLPKTITITSEEIRQALAEPIKLIIEVVKQTLEETPAELSADLVDRGIVLAGGGCLLRGFPELLSQETELPGTIAFWGRSGYSEVAGEGPFLTLAKELPLACEVPTPKAMYALGERLAPLLRPGDVVILDGDLGAGKTTLVQGIGAGLGVRGTVTSPTFVIARVHPPLDGGPSLVHVDAYRLSPSADGVVT